MEINDEYDLNLSRIHVIKGLNDALIFGRMTKKHFWPLNYVARDVGLNFLRTLPKFVKINAKTG